MFDAILVPSQALSSEPISFIITNAGDTQDRFPKMRDIATLIHSELEQKAGFRMVMFFSGSVSELRGSQQATKDMDSSLLSAVIVCKEGCQQLGVKY